jgi:hypothetical protein
VAEPPAWIRAWEAGYERGLAARAAGRSIDDLMAEDGWAEDLPLDAITPHVLGIRDALDPGREITAPTSLGAAIADAFITALLGVHGRESSPARVVFGLFVVIAGLDAPVAKHRRRRSTRAEVPPITRFGRLAAASLVPKLVYRRDARRRGVRDPSSWTWFGLALPSLWENDRLRRRDLAAWRAYVASRPDPLAPSDDEERLVPGIGR